ncbi:retrovirus-related Pol polyprotein from [Elysia marginata]|uniref:Retrovirus-related Pol polyprotein from n=1 Tax=Elysia marginata TaxID=1093978 RepID=A0AAV4GTB8_9GAST|nr:retrovirus-related Pol polyprotein from [Elysia marginata]
MACFDPKKEAEILVDASPYGLGAILTQQGKVVCYASRALTDVETRYSQTEREMLAVVYGVDKFHMYLYGSPDFTVSTDHKPLLGIIRSMKPCSARIEWRLRYALSIQVNLQAGQR